VPTDSDGIATDTTVPFDSAAPFDSTVPPPSDSGAPPGPDSAADTAPCLPPMTQCPAGCFDLQTDPNHCGFCGRPCAGLACESGGCQPGAPDSGADTGAPDGGGTCQSCTATATGAGGACSSQVTSCQLFMPCANVLNCLPDCAPNDTTCQNDCLGPNEAGLPDYNAITTCTCMACPSQCASTCPAPDGGADAAGDAPSDGADDATGPG
jgi:hypothetical protein